MARYNSVLIAILSIILINFGTPRIVNGAEDEVGPPPIITLPEAGAWYACDAPVNYCWDLPEGVEPGSVSGYELQFSNTQTPEGPWDAVRYFTSACWYYGAGHQEVYEALYWRVRIVYSNGDRSPWAISYHEVGTNHTPTEANSWGRIKSLF
jgi:hypothetical protein